MNERNLAVYNLGQNFIYWKLKRVGKLMKIRSHTLIEHEQQNTIQTRKLR